MPGFLRRGKKRRDRAERDEEDWEPEWLRHGVMGGDLPWNAAQHTTMETLLASYSLHDSYWLGQWLLPGQGLVGVIRWEVSTVNRNDPEWPAFEERVTPYPFLVLCFPHLYRLDQEVPIDAPDPFLYLTVIRADSRHLAEDEARQMLWPSIDEWVYERKGSVCETIFESVEGHRLRLLHGANVSVLLFDDEGMRVPVPRL